MAIYDVAKPFKSRIRKFAPGPGPGGVVTDEDDVSPLTIKQLKARNFIKPRSTEPAAAVIPPPNKMSAPAAQPEKNQVVTGEK